MPKTILITGSTDGIGLETAKTLLSDGHTVLVHGRNPAKLEAVEQLLAERPGSGTVEAYLADLSSMAGVEDLADAVCEKHAALDVLVNNAGIFKTHNPITENGLDVRFVVNTIAPFALTRRLLPLLGTAGRVVNLSSAAQAPVNLAALAGEVHLPDMPAYAQSKLAIAMWSRAMANEFKAGPAIITLNPGSMLGSKMVKEGFGVAGGDLQIGADIIVRASLADEFAAASGTFFDNDERQFSEPHPDALDPIKCQDLVRTIEAVLQRRDL